MYPCRWIFPRPADPCAVSLAGELSLPQLFAELLCRRGHQDSAAAALFLQPRLKHLRDPFFLPHMAAAVARLLLALDRRERIVLYGDYDVDGVTSLALLTRILRAYGGDVMCFLPLRVDEGYGLSREGLARCRETLRPELLVAVDCGTSSVAEIASLTEAGIDAIVLDHHVPHAALPRCVAVVNPQLGEEARELCSAGLAFKLAHALLKRRPCPGVDLREYLDLVALGTVADIVPLVGENRSLVRRGLWQLAQSRWPGVRALVQVAGASAPFTPGDVGFKLGPRLNAAGRLGTAQDALDLLLTEDEATATRLATSLDQQNRERRAVEDHVLAEAEAQIAADFDPAQHAAVVAGAPGWHPGVVGIVASRLVRRFHRPALVAGFDEAGTGKGSGRSVAGFSLVAALAACGTHLQKHGGHEMAAGFALAWPSFAGFRQAFLSYAGSLLAAPELGPRLELEGEVRLRDLHHEFLQQQAALQPFGPGNQQPLWFARGVGPAAEPRVLKEKHLSLRLRQGSHELRAIWFDGAASLPLPPPPWDIAFRLEANEYEGRVTPQIELRALRSSGGSYTNW